MASYSSSGAAVSWNDSALPGMGGVFLFSPLPASFWLSVRVVARSPWCAIVSRVAFTPGLSVSGASAARAWVSLWAWRAVSSSVST